MDENAPESELLMAVYENISVSTVQWESILPVYLPFYTSVTKLNDPIKQFKHTIVPNWKTVFSVVGCDISNIFAVFGKDSMETTMRFNKIDAQQQWSYP